MWTHTKRGCVKTEEELEWSVYKAEKARHCRPPPEATREAWNWLPQCHQKDSALPTSQSQTPGLLNCERINFSCLKASPLWYFQMEAIGTSYNYQQSSDIIWLIFLIHEVQVHIVCIVLHAYWYWLHTWKTCLLEDHKVLIWVLNFFIHLAFACKALSIWT